jgi:hypothetical protein
LICHESFDDSKANKICNHERYEHNGNDEKIELKKDVLNFNTQSDD